MDAALVEKIRDIPTEEINRISQAEGYSRWTYYTDAEAGEAGVIFANDDSLALYIPAPESKIQPGPQGKLKLSSLHYVPSGHQLYLKTPDQYLTLQVFSDPDTADQDDATAQDWQQFLTDHKVKKVEV
jgi:hypothetical protein